MLRPLPYRDVARKLTVAGFIVVSQNGSHVKFEKPTSRAIVIVPRHREVRVGTLRSIVRRAGLSVREFENL